MPKNSYYFPYYIFITIMFSLWCWSIMLYDPPYWINKITFCYTWITSGASYIYIQRAQQVLDRDLAKNLRKSQKAKKIVKVCLRSKFQQSNADLTSVWRIFTKKISNSNFADLRFFTLKLSIPNLLGHPVCVHSTLDVCFARIF